VHGVTLRDPEARGRALANEAAASLLEPSHYGVGL
jgi:hypothetical protein